MLEKIPPFFRSFYFLIGTSFLIWMLAFDSNDFISQWQIRAKMKDLEEEKVYYNEKIVEVEQEHEALFKDNRKLEKFAREKYLMKKPTEDIYLVVPKKEK